MCRLTTVTALFATGFSRRCLTVETPSSPVIAELLGCYDFQQDLTGANSREPPYRFATARTDNFQLPPTTTPGRSYPLIALSGVPET